MKKLYILFLICAISSVVNAQWEKVGYPGGEMGDIYQFGDLMIGTYGNYVYLSSDDGEYWTPFDDGLPLSNFIQFYEVYQINDTMVIKPYFISYQSGLKYRGKYYIITKENSTIWQETEQWLFSSSSAYGISKDSVFVIGTYAQAVTNGGAFGFTSDGGATWEDRTNGISGREISVDRYYISGKKVIIEASYTDTIYITDSTFNERSVRSQFVTSDCGEHWKKLIPSIADSLYEFEGLCQVDSATFIFLGTSFGRESIILYSSNGGDSWERPAGIDAQMWWGSSISKLSGSVLFMSLKDYTVSDTLHKCYVSYNSGKSWIRKSELTFKDGSTFDGVHWIYQRKVHDDGYLLRVIQGGWQNLILDTSFNVVRTHTFEGLMNASASVAITDDNKIIATTHSDSIFVSNDDGQNWDIEHTQEPKLSSAGWLVGKNYIYRSFIDNVYRYSSVLKSSDGGISWDTLSLPMQFNSWFSMSVSNDTIVMIRTNPETGLLTTFVSPDEGVSWHATPIPYYDLYSGHAIFNNVKDIYFISTKADYYYFSNDYGTSWDSIGVTGGTIPDLQIQNKGIYLSNDWMFSYGYGYEIDSSVHFKPFIFRCKRNASEWQALKTNLSDSVVPSSMIQIGKLLFMLSLSYNYNIANNDGTSRVFRSEDNGLTWVQIGETLVDGNSLHHNSKYLYISGTYGLYRYPLSLAGLHNSKPNSNNTLSLTTYPNPATKMLNVSVKDGAVRRVVMYDMTGALVRSEIVSGDAEWDVSTLPSGSYMLGIPDEGMQMVQVVK